ncbi:unnamed protein product [Sphenostylis stenocarpa]|uniref:non-specific serine/threonine protein kinase n=1 Tax=Sphenostylis stenocarpa TaxID=92480 RepID=A0AA87BAN6_9FABA|nr:unnamed protein product [Sphenostylis stenocarpa]
MAILTILLLFCKLFLFFCKFSVAKDTITQFEPLEDNKTLVSNDGTFELGFFTPATTSSNRYLGIWYANIPFRTVVWVANRDIPITDNFTKLRINTQGNLVLVNQNNTVIWSTNATTKGVVVAAQILDSGNLVLRDEKDTNPENYLWESFDYPSDTFLPGMKMGWDFKKGLIGTTEYYRSGPWDGTKFVGNPSSSNSVINYTFVSDKDGYYITYSINDKSMISRLVLNQTLYLRRQRLTWNNDSQTWRVSSQLPSDLCDVYNTCGAFGICVVSESPVCKCLDGFKPKAPQNWTQTNFHEGCVHNHSWSCGENKDGFQKFSNVKAPETTRSWVNASMTLEECNKKCRENCSCTAYANTDMRGEGSGCAIWFGDLLDVRLIPSGGQDLYIRLAVSQIDGQELAVKRLSQTSGQGLKEFKNEVMLCAKLQHRNLVKVLGFCIREDEKLLIYEYMANKSLDFFLFG